MPLNDLQCRNAKPRLKPYKLYDAGGLYLEVLPTGGKYWRYKYRIDGKEKRLAMGIYPDIALMEARNLHENARNQRKQGFDPVLLKGLVKQQKTYDRSQTLEAIAREWHEGNYAKWKKHYADEILRRLESNLFPSLGKLPIRQITTPMLYNRLKTIETRAPDMAKRVKQKLGEIFCYAVQTGRADRDLTAEMRRALIPNKTKHHASIDIDALPAFLKTLDDTQDRLSRIAYLAVRIMMLTFVRRSELLAAKWCEVDFDRVMWTIPPERMKMKLEHLVPLSKQVIACLRELYEITGNRELLFPSLAKPNKPIRKSIILDSLVLMGYKEKMTTHGFRALAMGVCKERLHYRHEIPDRQLAHVPQSEVDRAYDRSKFLPQRVQMMQKYADHLDSLTQPQPTQRTTTDDRTTNTITPQPYVFTASYRLHHAAGSTGYTQNLQNDL